MIVSSESNKVRESAVRFTAMLVQEIQASQ